MKGTPETPQCGFSRASIQILGLQGVDPRKFAAFNVLEDEELRQGEYNINYAQLEGQRDGGSVGVRVRDGCADVVVGIKEYSEWPTIPQLYVDKEFVGGTDIMMSMHQDGSLAKLLEEKDVLVPAESSSESESP